MRNGERQREQQIRVPGEIASSSVWRKECSKGFMKDSVLC